MAKAVCPRWGKRVFPSPRTRALILPGQPEKRSEHRNHDCRTPKGKVESWKRLTMVVSGESNRKCRPNPIPFLPRIR
jgi:hypothetical protein